MSEVKNSLPIERMTQEEFDKFRGEYLARKDERKRLSNEAVTKIRQAFALQDYNTLRVLCKKNHVHSMDCVDYDWRVCCVVDRLIEEIRDYRIYLNRIAGELGGR